jgi:hypothetical protein
MTWILCALGDFGYRAVPFILFIKIKMLTKIGKLTFRKFNISQVCLMSQKYSATHISLYCRCRECAESIQAHKEKTQKNLAVFS